MGSSNFDNSLESSMNPLDPEEFRRQGYMVIDFLADYYKNIEKYPVLSQVEPGYLSERLPESAPNSPERIDTILRDVQNHIFPGITHWQSPNFFAYFPASHSIAGFVGEMLASGFNVPGFNWISSPAATELEQIVMDWLGKLIQLPRSFLFSGNGGGVIHVTTCEAILCTLVAARERMLDQIGAENIGKLIVYCSDQTHSACQKATKIAGIRPENFRPIKTDKSKMFALCPNSLEKAISKDVDAGLAPFFLCATLGTTATTAVDPLRQLLKVTKEYGMWVHVDAAYAGSSLICPELQHFIDGIEDVDSLSLNPHKWLLTTLTCCCLWVKDTNCLKKPLTTTPEYLQNKASSTGEVVDYKDWQVSVSRRFQALKLWLVLRSYGVANLRTFLRRHVEMAKHLESLIAQDKRFEVVVPVNFSLVCFRLLPLKMHIGSTNGFEIRLEEEEDVANEMNKELLESINDSGQAFMTHAVVGGMFVIRVAIGATLTEQRHVAMAWKLVQETATRILGSSN